MRIDRIRLKDFCGVAEAEVRFAPKGVTIVHGPNEAGKSTLMQGINALFDHRDDSRKEAVRITKPVDRDVGSEVEADIEVGAFRFTYFKRFHKDRETRLTIHAPSPENLTGREAHERVQEILSSSLDTNLWTALRIEQGQNLQMPELQNQPALAQALDQAAGQAKSGEREEDIYESARNEFLQYFTDKGREKEDPIGRARTSAADTADKAQGLQLRLTELENDVTRFAGIAKETDTLSRSLPSLANAVNKARESWEVVSKLSENVERGRTAHQLAEQMLIAAKNASQQRRQMIEAAESARKHVDEVATKEGSSSELLTSTRVSLESTRRTRDRAKSAAGQAEIEERLRRADDTFRNEKFNLILLEERLGHVNTADAAASVASTVIAATSITEKLRAAIRHSELKLGNARVILRSAAPQLHIKALKRVSIVIDGTDTALEPGTEHSIPVAESRTVQIGQSVDIRIDPGTSAETLRQSVTDAETALTKACRDAGVATPEEAESAWQALQDAKRIVSDRDRIAKEHLRDLTREKLSVLVKAGHARVSVYLGGRDASLPLPANVEESARFLETAEQIAAEARKTYQAAEDSFIKHNEHHTKIVAAHAASAALLEQAKKDSAILTARLEEARKASADEALASALEKAENGASHSRESLKAAEANLGNADAQTTKAILDTSILAHQQSLDQHTLRERELLLLRTRLDFLGEEGLAETFAEAQRTAFEAQDALDRLLRRAMAAKLLLETLQSEREIMRRAYVAPLREGVERLGRHVFGPSLRVEVDESLRVVSRTIDGVTIMFDQLSTGAKEQMGLLVRLATAQIVSKGGGVPLILDDALGSTDETKFEAMGAVLRIASQDTQTIILTCAPERYLHVGAKEMVRL